jgi:hypothetical protein
VLVVLALLAVPLGLPVASQALANRPAQVHATCHEVGVRLGVGKSCGVREAYGQRAAALLAPLLVQQDVPGDAEDPRSRVVMEAGQLVEATPHDQERFCDNVFRMVWVCAALNESHEVRVDRLVQRFKGVLPISSP